MTAWQKYRDGIEKTSSAIDELIEKRRRLLGLDRPLIERAREEARTLAERGEVEKLQRQSAKARELASSLAGKVAAKEQEAEQLKAGLGRGATKAMVLEAQRQAEALRLSQTEMQLIADLYAKAAEETAKRLAAQREEERLLREQQTLQGKLADRARMDRIQDAERRTDLIRSMIGKSEEEKIRLQIADAQERYSVALARSRREDTTADDVAAYTVELEEITAEIATLNERLREIEKTRADQLASVQKREAEYAFSRLTPEQQLAAISFRMREIMSKPGWDKDADARAELLDLRKRRDAIEEDRKKERKETEEGTKKSVPPWSFARLDNEASIAVWESLRRRRSDHVIRMRGSRAGGFMDEDGVRRMTGSLAGGFSSRLIPSAFARSAAELDAKRRGLAEVGKWMVATTGEEQPVEIKGEAVNYLRIMASALSKEA
ncbi:MAG: hypothetical protein NZM29_08830 [Nitrospira sp.]|nr:hypothetical protein [Nitrospira sp.]